MSKKHPRITKLRQNDSPLHTRRCERVLAPLSNEQLNQVKSNNSNQRSEEPQIIALDKWAKDDLFKSIDPELQHIPVYHPCLVTESSDLIIKCYSAL